MFKPYVYQDECLTAIQASRDAGALSALAVMASGLGKTVTVAFDARRWYEGREGGRILYLCHQTDILDQAKATFEAIFDGGHSFGFLTGQHKHLHDVDCLFASLQTMRNYLDFFGPNEFDYIVVDESHHSHAETFKDVITYFRPKFLLGVTATPNRFDQQNIRDIYGEEVYYLPLEEALARGLLTPVDYRLLSDEIQVKNVLDTPQGELSVKYLNRKIFIPRRDEEIGQIITHHASEFPDPRIMIFCASVRHCDEFCAHVPGSLAIHSKIPAKERALRLEFFRQGLINTVVTVDCFNEGIDIPQANVIVFLRSTASPTIFLQQLGRGLRLSDGKDKVLVLDFVGNCQRISMVYELWKAIQQTREYQTAAPRSIGEDGRQTVDVMTLNIVQSGFSESIVEVVDLLERLRPKMLSDIPEIAIEYLPPPKNLLPTFQVITTTGSRLWWKCSKCNHEWQATGKSRVEGHGCPACAGKVATASNNLAVIHPQLVSEYSEKNELTPYEMLPCSNRRVWWRCAKCQHEWQATVANRTGNKSGCPACAGKVATATNNLTITHPQLVAEYATRNKLPATQFRAGSDHKPWWHCPVCQYEWQATINSRVKGAGCPACANQVVTETNNMAVTHPNLAAEYSEKNVLPAKQVVAGTAKKLWWRCTKCQHEWQATGANRRNGQGCPICSRKATIKIAPLTNSLSLAGEYSALNHLPFAQAMRDRTQSVKWHCHDCGHNWGATILSRLKGSGCPKCAKLQQVAQTHHELTPSQQ